ncbi:MAG: DUF1653 domain-containing protein [Bacteroidota bacterium]|jgi:hypothetical protein|nr:DUF1653 domain-containing protein [Sphingobacteriales bacterium]
MKKGIYKHYKGKLYKVTGFARHSETLEEMVIYEALYDSEEFGYGATWVRPRKMFEEEVIVKGAAYSRFMFVGDKLN